MPGADPLTDPVWVDSSAKLLAELAREWIAGAEPQQRITVLDLQEALHAFEMQRAMQPVVAMSREQRARKGYWVGWSTGPQPVLTDSFEIMKYGTGPMPVIATDPLRTFKYDIKESDNLFNEDEYKAQEPVTAELDKPVRRRSRKAKKEVPDVEPGQLAPAGDDRPTLAGEVLAPDPAAGDQGDVSKPSGPLP
jgi:hypothetical protein